MIIFKTVSPSNVSGTHVVLVRSLETRSIYRRILYVSIKRHLKETDAENKCFRNNYKGRNCMKNVVIVWVLQVQGIYWPAQWLEGRLLNVEYIYIYMYVCIYIYMYIYIHVCVCVRAYTFFLVRPEKYTCINWESSECCAPRKLSAYHFGHACHKFATSVLDQWVL
jgi:hypothetical protein